MKTLKLLTLLLLISTFAKAQQNIQIGDIYTFEDDTKGVVFYIDEEGHGLAVSLTQEKRRWADETNYVYCQDIVNIDNDPLPNFEFCSGMGKFNTSYILQQLGTTKPTAAKYCRELGEEWYLPTASEFYKLLLGNVDGEVNKTLKVNKCKPIMGWYWTSSEYDNGQAWTMNSSGRFKKCSKLAYRNVVRAIRQF